MPSLRTLATSHAWRGEAFERGTCVGKAHESMKVETSTRGINYDQTAQCLCLSVARLGAGSAERPEAGWRVAGTLLQ